MSSNIILACLGLLLASGACSFLMVPLVRRLALAINLVDQPGERKIHAQTIPYGGGIAIFFSFIITIAISYLLLISDWDFYFLNEIRNTLEPHMAGLLAETTLWRLGGMLAGGGAIFVLGLADDHYGCGAYSKLAVQILMAALLWYSGTRITLFIGHWTASLALTVFWMVLITNAMNLLDNMDGLSSGVGVIAAAIFMAVAVQAGQIFVASLMAVLIGSLLGFLWFNFNPASIFMGDAGSLFLGYMLGAISISSTYYQGSESGLAVVIPLVVLAIPLFDTASVMLIRWRTGKPFMQGDKNHFSHRLVRLGMTTREAVLTIYVLTASLGLTAILLQRLDRWGGVLVLLHTFGILVVVGLLEHAAHRRRS